MNRFYWLFLLPGILSTTPALSLEFTLFGRSTGGITQTVYEPAGGDKENYVRVLPDSWFAQSFGFKYTVNPRVSGKIELTVYRATDSTASTPYLKNFYFDILAGPGTLTIGTQPTLHTQVAYYHDVLLGGHDGFRSWVAGPAYQGSLNAFTYKMPAGPVELGFSLVEARQPGGADGSSTTAADGSTTVTPKETSTPALELSLTWGAGVGGGEAHAGFAYHSEEMGIEDASDAENLEKTERASVMTAIAGFSTGPAYFGATFSQGDPILYWEGRRMFGLPAGQEAISIRKGLKDKYTAQAVNFSLKMAGVKGTLYYGAEEGKVDGAKMDIAKTSGIQFEYPWNDVNWFLAWTDTQLQKQEADYIDITTSTLGADFKF